MCHPHMRFGPEYKDLCHHAEQLLSVRVWLFQPAGTEARQKKTHRSIIREFIPVRVNICLKYYLQIPLNNIHLIFTIYHKFFHKH